MGWKFFFSLDEIIIPIGVGAPAIAFGLEPEETTVEPSYTLWPAYTSLPFIPDGLTPVISGRWANNTPDTLSILYSHYIVDLSLTSLITRIYVDAIEVASHTFSSFNELVIDTFDVPAGSIVELRVRNGTGSPVVTTVGVASNISFQVLL